MNNKGLTLAELLAVIVVLGLLLLIAVPIIQDVVDDTKKSAFLGEAQSVYRAALIRAIDLANTGDGGIISSEDSTKLDMDGNELDYCVIVNSDAEITFIKVSNGTYLIEGDSNFMSLDSSNVTLGNMNNFTCE